MPRVVEAIRAPGRKGEIAEAAPTQLVTVTPVSKEITSENPEKVAVASSTPFENVTGFVLPAKRRLLDRWLDAVVHFSGSEPVFLLILAAIIAWAFLGIRFGQSENWAVLISDVQAIVSYVFDSLLMRQQLNEYDRDVRVAAMLRSRIHSQKRMLRAIVATSSNQYALPSQAEVDRQLLHQEAFETELPAENWLGKVSTFCSAAFGHVVTCALYWVCIFVWLGFGHYCGWSDVWQLYINSSTSALMLLIFAFLANIQERHGAHIGRCLDVIFRVDSAIESRLRSLTADRTTNPVVTVPAPVVGRLQRAIFYYADVVGTLVGIAILLTVMAAWLAIGPVMAFGPNWWLLIGTYAGLVGMNDGFVLDNVQARLHDYVDGAFEAVLHADWDLVDDVGGAGPQNAIADGDDCERKMSASQRLSIAMGRVCSHPATVVLGVVAIVGLIVGASAMRWTLTGQLLCNIPPSIVESFFMMALITGHNLSDEKRRTMLQDMYQRRLRLLAWVNALEPLRHEGAETAGGNITRVITA